MPSSRHHTTTIIFTLLSTLVVVMAVYVLFRFVQTNKMPAATPSISQQPTTPIDPGAAFIHPVSVTTPVQRDGLVTVVFDSNEWSVCAIDVYQPDEKYVTLSKDASKPQQVAPGRFSWTWKLPNDAVSGEWLARVLCGKADNLATVDQKFTVQ